MTSTALTDKEKIQKLRTALQVLLGDMDFRNSACSPTDMVSAVVNPITLTLCDEALENTKE